MKTTLLLSALVSALAALTATTTAQGATPAEVAPSSVAASSPLGLSTLALLAELPPPTVASLTPSNPWDLSLSFPVWIPAVDGDVTIRGLELSPDQDTGDTLDIFDSQISGALVLHFEARKGRAGFFIDTMYIDLSADNSKLDNDREAFLRGFIGEAAVFYTMIEPKPGERGWGTFRLDALGGVRVSSVKIGIEENDDEVSANQTVYDPMIGARFELGLTDWLSLRARGDVGGFGISAWSTTNFTFNFDTSLQFHLAEWFELGVGYRWLNYDFETDSGESSFDATLSGPVLTLQFNF